MEKLLHALMLGCKVGAFLLLLLLVLALLAMGTL